MLWLVFVGFVTLLDLLGPCSIKLVMGADTNSHCHSPIYSLSKTSRQCNYQVLCMSYDTYKLWQKWACLRGHDWYSVSTWMCRDWKEGLVWSVLTNDSCVFFSCCKLCWSHSCVSVMLCRFLIVKSCVDHTAVCMSYYMYVGF
jgi:hypothetical protein